METKRVIIRDAAHPKEEELREAAQILQQGGLVAFPTETVYGLGGNALDETAAKRIYAAKGRPSDNPLIAHISSMEELLPLVSRIPEAGRRLAERFWPGPLTMIFPKSEQVPFSTTGGLDTVAVRMPSDPVAMKLIRMAGVPVAAPSANTSGRPSPTTADHVWEDLNGKIEMIVDGGAVGIGVESTIVDVTGPVPVILRPGFITLEMLQEMFDQVKIDPAILGPMADGVRPKAPGMKYKHYAPLGQLTLVELKEETKKALHTPGSSQWQEVEEAAQKRGISLEHADLESIYMALQTDKLAAEKEKQGAKTGVICTEETEKFYETKLKGRIGQRAQADTVAHNLYRVLRDFDDLQVEYIYSESFAGDHLGQAIMNRLNKAAGYHIIYV
ncbi:MAG TPA: threonylcarbamoyl-AMP synthase [Candidatus Cottocaccamicrobium excrementipullorum]|nr:threonylcarbamoyl-AMP synthase [Candidatus Cottocaccamicrobium excrementipullorum]